MVTPVFPVLNLRQGGTFKAVWAGEAIDNGGDAVLASLDLTVAAEVEFTQGSQLGARTRVEHPVFVVKRQKRHLDSCLCEARGSLGTRLGALP